jgi:hypothetical protein
LEVDILGDLVEQGIENGVGFRFGDTEHATGNARVDGNALSLPGDTNDRVYSFDQLATDVEASRFSAWLEALCLSRAYGMISIIEIDRCIKYLMSYQPSGLHALRTLHLHL